ncbi:oxidoreductase [Clostridium felsineum]|uniref:oxidoreductase n=1 Tax=Clostridium felsineum TaxID=36839 RepID=UPI00098C5E87|nr:FAD-dependent oxidoreductase [Clostridium felsineum]URZ03954.1 NADH oxidase [Clostridium felsineum]
MKYKNLLSPIVINRMSVRNRVVMTPMGTNFADVDGEFKENHIKYYEQRAKGGTGLIIVENACVDFPLGSNGTTQIRIDHDRFMPSLNELVNRVHRFGASIAIQINHSGASAVPGRIGQTPVSSSNIPSKTGGAVPRELTKDEIYEIAKKYGEAAKRAQSAGFDAIEIHGGHSYLISQFLSPVYNKREDEFGGSVENRTRFARLVIDSIRKEVGPIMPISLRVSAEEFVEGGNTLEDTLKILEYLDDGVDIYNVSAALNDSLYYQIDQMNLEDGWRAYMSEAVKKKFDKPVIITGNIRDPKVAEKIIEDKKADFIGMGRGLIAEPYWVEKVKNNEEALLRKCISCNIGCANNRIAANCPIKCTVNPDLINNDEYKKNKVKKPTNVVVIGGGTAGLEAACTAAEVGCTTFLIEEKPYLGGLASEISRLPDKKRISDFPKYLVNRSETLSNLFVFKNTKADAEVIKKFNPDVVVNATGSTPLLPPIEGLKENINKENGKVKSIFGLLNDVDKYDHDYSGKDIVVVGGGAVGLDVAEFFSKRNAKVKMVEMMPVVAKDLDLITKMSMMKEMKEHEVEIYTETVLKEVCEDHFKVTKDGKELDLNFDYGFVCLGMKAYNPEFTAILENFEDAEVLNIGDSRQARKIISGTEEGRNIIFTLKKIGVM